MSGPTEQHVTCVETVDFPLSDGTKLRQLTLSNAAQRPITLGPTGLENLRKALTQAHEDAVVGKIAALAITGNERYFLAGADLTVMEQIADGQHAAELGRTGHAVFALLADLPIPTFAFISGAALGGGLELALHADYRLIASGKAPLALPEVSLGIIPGWGGCWLLPRLIGIEAAIEVIVSNPLRNNRKLRPEQAQQLGLVDKIIVADDFPAAARQWASQILSGAIEIQRRSPDTHEAWQAALQAAQRMVEARIGQAAPAPYRALDLLNEARESTREAGYAREDAALAELIMSPEFKASLYAFNLVNRAGKNTLAAAQADPLPIMRAGVVGAGLMASQLARVLAEHLQIDVVMRDLDAARVASGVQAIEHDLERDVAAERLSAEQAAEIRHRIHGTIELEDFRDCQLVIEAVTEKMEVKREVFSELATIVSRTAVLATNTSALSITEMAAHLDHPERVIGLHFFNPVQRMPLVEIVKTGATSQVTVATALSVVQSLRKSGVVVADAPGFVVNRILLRFLAEIFAIADQGTELETVENGVRNMGLPMSPFALLDLVGPAVAEYVLETLHENLGPRYYLSQGLHQVVEQNISVFDAKTKELNPGFRAAFATRTSEPSSPISEAEVLSRVQQALGDEVQRMLSEKIVKDAPAIDLCMILGAGWPLFLGGITPYLRRTGHLEMEQAY